MKQADIGLLRLRAQLIAGHDYKKPDEVVRHLLAMQAQDYAGALWSIGLRTQGSQVQDIEKAIVERKIVRTWPMRGTLHFLHADDVHWMLDLLAPRATSAVRGRRINQLGLTDAIVEDARTVLVAELRGGRSIARNEVAELLKSNVKSIAIDGERTQHLLRHFGEKGVICFGPHVGKQPTFVLLDEWIEKPAKKSKEDSLSELAERFFVSHGPATLIDFAGWGKLTLGDARAAVASAKESLKELIFDDVVHYMAPDLSAADVPSTYLLPGFDEFVLGYKQRDSVLSREYAQKVVPGGNGVFLPTVVSNGQVVGLWKRRLYKARVTCEYSYFDAASIRDDVAEQESRYESFLFGS